MLSEKEVVAYLSDLESDRIERTISIREEKLGEAICAFCNDFSNHKKPAYIFIGANDDGSLAGMTFDDKKLQSIGAVRANGNVLPQPSMVVSDVFHFTGGDLVVVEVYPSFHPPVRYKGKCWIRVGPRKAVANEADERLLTEKRTSTAKTFDLRPYPGTTQDDLDADIFSSTYLPQAVDKTVLAANHRSLVEQLASLRMYDLVHDCPTNAGIVVLGIDPLFYLQGAYIQYVKLPGDEITHEIDYEKKFSGALISVLPQVDAFVKGNILKSKPVQTGSMRENQISNYPLWALREFVMNAIMHRDYESNAPIKVYEFVDRIEITNPGGLYGLVKPENFPEASDYRNPEIAEAMKVLGYVNRFNFGVRNAERELEKNGNPKPEYDLELITNFKVTVYIQSDWH